MDVPTPEEIKAVRDRQAEPHGMYSAPWSEDNFGHGSMHNADIVNQIQEDRDTCLSAYDAKCREVARLKRAVLRLAALVHDERSGCAMVSCLPGTAGKEMEITERLRARLAKERGEST